MRRASRIGSLGAAALGLAVFVRGMAAGPAKQDPIRHDVTVIRKLIQVFVTGPKGKPALDLDKSDFILRDNGKPQPITEFERHVLAVPAGAPAPGAPAAPPPPAAAPLLARKFIFLIDYDRNGLAGVQKAKSVASEFLDSKVAPDDEVGLFTLSPSGGLTLHERLTTDHARVRRRLKKLRDNVGVLGEPLGGELTGMELWNAEIFGPHGGHAGPSGRDLFEEMAEWAKALRAIPGQKNIILFSMGFGTGAVHPGGLDNGLFENMARALASANAPVFTVDTAPQATPGRRVEDKLPSGTLPELSLAHLSEATGGKFLGGVDAHTRIASDIQEATANYYVLGYAIPAAWDGKYHEVRVEVAKPGCVVHAQRGYFNPVPFGKLTPLEKHLHLLEVALGEGTPAGPMAAFPVAALPFPQGGGTGTLLIAEFPAGLRAVLGDHVEFVSLVLNEDRAIVDGKRWEVDPKDLGTSKIFQYSVAFLGPGRYEVRAVLRNLDDGRALSGSCAVDVVPAKAPEPMIYPPLLLAPGMGARYLNLSLPAGAGRKAPFSISEAFPFPTGELEPLVGALGAGATALWAEIACVWGDARAGEKDLSVLMRREGDGEEVTLAVELVSASSREERDVYLLRLGFAALTPGSYRLEIAAGTAPADRIVVAGRFSVRRP